MQPQAPRTLRGQEADMLDLIYLAAGVAAFAVLGGYAVALRRI